MIRIENLYKSFGQLQVLKGINLEVPKGKITVIVGRSGQGKSVLLKHIIGLLKPDSGEIYVDDKLITRMSANELNRVRRRCGMLFQDAALFDSMDVFDNVSFPLVEHTALDEEEIAARVARTLALVDLYNVESKWPAELSGGMKKRVGLARALVLEPEIMLYDEPTTGLDPITSAQINQLIIDTQRRLQMTALVISHDMTSTRQVADQVVMLHAGEIVEAGDVDSFFNSNEPAVLQFLKGEAQGPLGESERNHAS